MKFTSLGYFLSKQVLEQVVFYRKYRGPIPPKEAPLFKVVGKSGSGKSSWLRMRLTDLRNLVKRKLVQGEFWAAGKLFQAEDFKFLQSILDPGMYGILRSIQGRCMLVDQIKQRSSKYFWLCLVCARSLSVGFLDN